MRVASEQASGEKYKSIDASLAVLVGERDQQKVDPGFASDCAPLKQSGPGIDFYTVPHNINRVKGFFAKWYKKVKSRRCRPGHPRLQRQSAAAGGVPISPKTRAARR